MIRTWFKSLLSSVPASPHAVATTTDAWRISETDDVPDLLYVIGDVHGRLDLLVELEDRIANDRAGEGAPAMLVLLGDVIDRGPATKAVIDHLLAPPPEGMERLCLAGNHEEMLLNALSDPGAMGHWIDNGGTQTLLSYGVPASMLGHRNFDAAKIAQTALERIPAAHLEFLTNLTLALRFGSVWLCHAGIAPALPLSRQRRADLLWMRRYDEQAIAEKGITLVHGHTPQTEIHVTPHRINVDTGAVFSGHLTAAKFVRGAFAGHLST